MAILSTTALLRMLLDFYFFSASHVADPDFVTFDFPSGHATIMRQQLR